MSNKEILESLLKAATLQNATTFSLIENINEENRIEIKIGIDGSIVFQYSWQLGGLDDISKIRESIYWCLLIQMVSQGIKVPK